MENENINESTTNFKSEGIEPGSGEPTAAAKSGDEGGERGVVYLSAHVDLDENGRDLALEENRESALKNSDETVDESAHVEVDADQPARPAENCKVKQISEDKREANRRNAQFSTGPKSEEGKMRSRMNAILHGLLIRAVPLADFVVSGERRELRELFETLYSELCPEGRVEEMFVGRIACIYFHSRPN
jgi:hypothetical protein